MCSVRDSSLILLLQFSLGTLLFLGLALFKNKIQGKIIPPFHTTVLQQVLRGFLLFTGLGNTALFKIGEHLLGKRPQVLGLLN